jgi:hypothetical protein
VTRFRAACALLLLPSLAACGDSKPKPPKPRPPAATAVVVCAPRGSGLLESAIAHLSGRPLAAPGPDGAAVPAAARSWSHSPDFRRWTFEVDRSADWASAWPGPGTASAPEATTLAVALDAPDADLPARLCAATPVPNGDYAPPSFLGADWRLLAPRAAGRPTLRFGSSDNPRQSIEAFRAGQLARLDFIPADNATALRNDPAFRAQDAASTIVLVLELEDSRQRAAIADALDPESLCRRAVFDPGRAAKRIVPAALGLAEPGAPRPARPGPSPAVLTLDADAASAEAVAFLPPIREALRRAGMSPTDPEASHAARLRVRVLSADTPALVEFFRPLRHLAADHPELAPLFESLESALDPAERADWARALEAALLESRLVIPLARGVIYSLARAGSGVELDRWGRYVPVVEAGR